ncbi:MAG: cyclic nucleotide-binding domain-containing protein [Bacteroidota bacterium]
MSLWSTLMGSDPDTAYLHRSPLFAALSDRERSQLHRAMHERYYMAGATIFRKGDPGLGLFVLREGEAVVVTEPDDRIVHTLRTGDCFGEIALLHEAVRSATVRAKSDTHMAVLAQPMLRKLVDQRPRLAAKLLWSVAQATGQRLIDVSEELAQLRQRSTPR